MPFESNQVDKAASDLKNTNVRLKHTVNQVLLISLLFSIYHQFLKCIFLCACVFALLYAHSAYIYMYLCKTFVS